MLRVSPHIARECKILAQGRGVTVRDGTEKHGYSLVEGTSRAVARMNQREIAQVRTVASNDATPSRRKALLNKYQSAHAAPVSCNMRATWLAVCLCEVAR